MKKNSDSRKRKEGDFPSPAIDPKGKELVSALPNILLIIADDLGLDVVNITGSGTNRAMQVHTHDGDDHIYGALPNISLLLRNGKYFSQAWAQPACSPTRASIFTGWHPWKNGVGNPERAQLDSAKGFTTLPNRLKTRGYVSGLFGKWHLGEVEPFLPTNYGWDKHVGTLDGVLPEKLKDPYMGYGDWIVQDSDDDDYGLKGYLGAQTSDYATWRTVNEAAKWINAQDPSTPWFATIAFHSPHAPFHTPSGGYDAATAGKTKNSEDYMFNVMAQNMDFYIGNLLGTVGGSSAFKNIEEDQLSNTIIIFIGDNGSAAKVALEEAKNYIYEGSVRVPMIFADGQAVMNEINGQAITPRFLHADGLNASSSLMIHVVDLYDTITRLSTASGGTSDSHDFSLVVESGRYYASNYQFERDYNFSQYYENDKAQATLRNKTYKLNIQYSINDPTKAKWAFYRYSGDEIPGQEDDGTADDIFADSLSLAKIGAGVELKSLLDYLIANYHPVDDTKYTFPDPRL
jgi:arylsulfatase B